MVKVALCCLVLAFLFHNEKVVTDENGKPIPNVNISCLNKVQGVVSDNNGNYNISHLDCDTFVFSRVGYATQEVAVEKLPDTIKLCRDTLSLFEFELKSEYDTKMIGFTQKRWLPGQTGSIIGHINGLIQKNIPRGRLSKVEVFIKNSCDQPENKLFLKVMSVDSSLRPNDDLLLSQVEIPAVKRRWVTIDLRDKFIPVKDKIFLGCQIARNPNLKEHRDSCFNMIGQQLVEVDSNYRSCWKNDSLDWIIRDHQVVFKDQLFIPMIRAQILH